jgi:hypothetical protein
MLYSAGFAIEDQVDGPLAAEGIVLRAKPDLNIGVP